MNKKQFIHRVQEIYHISDARTAEEATRAVLHTLSHRLTREEADDVCDQLSTEVKNLWIDENFISRMIQKFKGTQLRFRNRTQMYEHIRQEMKRHKVSVDDLEPFTMAVFHVLKEQIDEGESQDVAAQLPEEIKELWWAA